MVNDPKQQKSATARSEPLSDETVEMVSAMLKVLGDPTRIRLIEILNERGSATVSALTACLPVSQQGVSKQLGVLHQAGVVSRRVGSLRAGRLHRLVARPAARLRALDRFGERYGLIAVLRNPCGVRGAAGVLCV